MNEISVVVNSINTCDKKDISKSIMSICRMIAPQFYKKMELADIKAERTSIEVLVNNIDQNVLSDMCMLAINQYGQSRSKNEKEYFDINYIMKFYTKCFNFRYCEMIDITNYKYISGNYDKYTNVLTEVWKNDNAGTNIEIKYIPENDYKNNNQRVYSPKYFEKIRMQTYKFNEDDI